MDEALKRKLSIRWFYLAVGIVLMLFLGLIYAWSVFRMPLEQEFNWSSAESSVTFSISMMMFCIGGLISGILTSKKGAKVTLRCCATCLAVGFIGASKINTLMGIYITYGGLCGFGVGLGYNAIIGTILKWFPDKQGLISGVILMGFGFGSMVLGTVGAQMILAFGWRNTFFCFGVAFAIIFLLASVLIQIAPDSLSKILEQSGKQARPAIEELDYKQMLRRKNFWLFFFWAICVSSAGMMIMNISATYANLLLGDNLTRAATIAGIISITNGIGRVCIGQLFDWKGYRVTMMADVLLYILAGALLLCSFMTMNVAILVIAYIVSGFAYGGISPNISAFTSYFFGRKNFTLNYSIAYLNLLVASFLGPLFAADQYNVIFMGMIGLALIGFVLTFCIQKNR